MQPKLHQRVFSKSVALFLTQRTRPLIKENEVFQTRKHQSNESKLISGFNRQEKADIVFFDIVWHERLNIDKFRKYLRENRKSIIRPVFP